MFCLCFDFFSDLVTVSDFQLIRLKAVSVDATVMLPQNTNEIQHGRYLKLLHLNSKVYSRLLLNLNLRGRFKHILVQKTTLRFSFDHLRPVLFVTKPPWQYEKEVRAPIPPPTTETILNEDKVVLLPVHRRSVDCQSKIQVMV